ncbi:efflux RND transporter periplasmic adaptor subunit [Glaciecola sp. MF2-115]|uniref:efflux RND transporter periplasmic adaptor subunit n=1 Tax=Glaciecola sp. MF2-115 TaxID=3384827 RepID=UPI0039A19C7D
MSNTNDTSKKYALKDVLLATGLAVGVTLLIVALKFMDTEGDETHEPSASKEKEPLYWVAPMDPNFRKDKPGLSPMGMDLVPVYADDANSEDSPGTVKINPNVVNNLGVRTALAERRTLDTTINTVGYVQYSEDTLVHVHPRVEGWVEVLNVKSAGEYVEKGDALYALYSPELVNAQEEFLLALKRQNSNLMSAARSRLQALQMPEKAIKQLVASGKVQQTVVFTAPQTGFIDNLNIREGFYVKPGMTLMSIAGLNEVWVDAEVFERQSNLVKLDLPVTMTMAYLPGKTWEGKVDYIYPTLDANTRTLRLRLKFNNEGYFLKPNMFAQISIFTQLSSMNEPNVAVPSEAVIRTGSQNRVVLALGEGKFKSVEVSIGNVVETEAGSFTEILAGLMNGDKVVTSAQFLLDSESSISSDFTRIGGELPSSDAMSDDDGLDMDMDMDMDMDDTDDMSSMHGGGMSMGSMSEPTWVEATVDEAMPDERMVRLTHGDIDDWGMPGMTMNFTVAESVDFAKLKVGTSLQVKISKPDKGMFEVIGVKP